MVTLVTLEEAKHLKYHQVLLYKDGSRWRVNGAVKTWKTDPSRVQVPIKHGLYSYDYITERNAYEFKFEGGPFIPELQW